MAVCPYCGDSNWTTTSTGQLKCKVCDTVYQKPEPKLIKNEEIQKNSDNFEYDFESRKIKLISECKKSVCFIRVEYASGAVTTGTGWCGADNLIITNAHVIALVNPNDMYNSIICEFPEETGLVNNRIPMAPIYLSVAEDIAVLYPLVGELPKEIKALKRSNDKLYQGQTVFTIGNPLGEKFVYTEGKVNRTNCVKANSAFGSIQTDIKIDHGNSGGAIFNMKGEVVAMSTYDEKKVENLEIVAGDKVINTPVLTAKGFCFGVTIEAINMAIASAKTRL